MGESKMLIQSGLRHNEKTGFLPMRKHRRRSAVQ